MKGAQRLFFWNQDKNECGVVVLPPGKTINYSRVKSLMQKLVADAVLREKHRRELEFPLEQHYSEYDSLLEEAAA